MQYEHCTTEQLVQEIIGRRIHDLPHLRDIKRNPDLLLTIDGIGAVSAKRIRAALELGIRYATEPSTDKPVITGPEDVVEIYGPRLRDLDHERFYVLLMDNGGRITYEHLVSQGIANASLVHPREVFREAIRRSASNMILLHNHPSAVREASQEDFLITSQLVEAGKIIDIQIHDHIIIAGHSYVSFAENGWLEASS
ncbi:DNA repair protein RadC [bacterium]|nr:DNA repair protein RadC [bacterium]